MKKKSNKGIFFIKMITFFMCIATCFLMKNTGGRELLLNFFFLAVMYMLILTADRKGICIMDSVAYDSTRIKEQLRQLSQEKKGKELLEIIGEEEELCFSDSFVQEIWKEYLEKEIPEPLENYLSEEFIYEKVNKSFCDMVPGILTALGIL